MTPHLLNATVLETGAYSFWGEEAKVQKAQTLIIKCFIALISFVVSLPPSPKECIYRLVFFSEIVPRYVCFSTALQFLLQSVLIKHAELQRPMIGRMLPALCQCAAALMACISCEYVRSLFNKEGWVIPENDVSSLLSTLIASIYSSSDSLYCHSFILSRAQRCCFLRVCLWTPGAERNWTQ